MMWLPLAQSATDITFWRVTPANPGEMYLKMGGGLLAGLILVFALSRVPQGGRKYIVGGATFLAGLFWVLYYLWPQPVNWQDGDIPRNGVEAFARGLEEAIPVVSPIAQVLTAFLLGLGIFSLLRVHFTRISHKQRDWQFSVVLLVSMLTMVIFGYWDFILSEFRMKDALATMPMDQRPFPVRMSDLLFNGFIQNMEATMFSLIAFFIFSAAYRAFRIRSLESTLLMGSALLVMLSLMSMVSVPFGGWINSLTGNNPASLLQDFTLTEVATWIRNNVQVPAIRALEIGTGLGALAMGLRIWLGLEKGGIS